jgi:hypothetical protein
MGVGTPASVYLKGIFTAFRSPSWRYMEARGVRVVETTLRGALAAPLCSWMLSAKIEPAERKKVPMIRKSFLFMIYLVSIYSSSRLREGVGIVV